MGVLQFCSLCAIVTNIAIVVVTDNRFELSQEAKWGLFIIIEHSVLIGCWLLQAAIPDEAQRTTDMKRRHAIVIKTKYQDVVGKKKIANLYS
jgi:hypothetical protein